ncbi:MAG: tRNA (adenosine(37)-N6)-threonylcarbamoyltransferase complex dimerization subunit type 1 TsaB [Pseudomonadota bacterium]|nr:tRNA (adenosine(37)-N6)-threonylcarbamoyltransferase complex dimerization subunit type 1 TsaB [Pseudomonadota bacterium]
MTVLALETSGSALSVAVLDTDGTVRAAAFQRRQRGHAEELMPMLGRVLARAGATMPDLSLLAVTVGPGTFTGVRIGLAAARGLRLALRLPLVGLTSLEVIAAAAAQRAPDTPVLAAIDARRDQVYVQLFGPEGGAWQTAWTGPAAMGAEAAAAMLVPGTVLAGSGAALVAAKATVDVTMLPGMEPQAGIAGGLALARGHGGAGTPPPKPLYLRAPDAKVQVRP